MNTIRLRGTSFFYLKAFLIAFLLTGMSVNAYAQNFYGGFSIGSFDDEIISDSDTGWKIFGGYQLNPNFAIEVAYVDLGTVEESAFGSSISADQSGISGTIVGIAPLNSQFSLFGKFGLFLWDSDIKFTNVFPLGTGSASDSGTDITYGFGAKVDLQKAISLRAEWEHFEDDIGDLFSIGISFKF